jgi:predicted GIY-YIG superfamily endonuclease
MCGELDTIDCAKESWYIILVLDTEKKEYVHMSKKGATWTRTEEKLGMNWINIPATRLTETIEVLQDR